MKKDKKNTSSDYNFSLLNNIGEASFDETIEEEMILESLEYLNNLEF